jgi:hypothetical protein
MMSKAGPVRPDSGPTYKFKSRHVSVELASVEYEYGQEGRIGMGNVSMPALHADWLNGRGSSCRFGNLCRCRPDPAPSGTLCRESTTWTCRSINLGNLLLVAWRVGAT